jgi:predicted ester cyclase
MSTRSAAETAQGYFEAIARRDIDTALTFWRPGGIDNLAPVGELRVPDQHRAHFQAVFAAFPDFAYEVIGLIAEGDRVAVHWRAEGTFTGEPYQGIDANGAHVTIEGADICRVEDGLLVRLDSYWDDSAVARQLGLLPARQSFGERLLLGLFNLRTALGRALRRAR